MASKHRKFFKENSEDYHAFHLCVWKWLKHLGREEGGGGEEEGKKPTGFPQQYPFLSVSPAGS